MEGEADSRVGSGGAVPNKPLTNQGVLQGVAFTGVQVLREKRLILLQENRKNEVKLPPPPLCAARLKHSMKKLVSAKSRGFCSNFVRKSAVFPANIKTLVETAH